MCCGYTNYHNINNMTQEFTKEMILAIQKRYQEKTGNLLHGRRIRAMIEKSIDVQLLEITASVVSEAAMATNIRETINGK